MRDKAGYTPVDAENLDWSPLRIQGVSGARSINLISDNKLEIGPSFSSLLFTFLFALVGISFSLFAYSSKAPLVFVVAPFFFTVPFWLSLMEFLSPTVIDKTRWEIRKGKEVINLDELLGIQILKAVEVDSTTEKGRRTYTRYQLNLALKDGRRLFVEEADLNILRKHARLIGDFLGCPIFDRGEGNIVRRVEGSSLVGEGNFEDREKVEGLIGGWFYFGKVPELIEKDGVIFIGNQRPYDSVMVWLIPTVLLILGGIIGAVIGMPGYPVLLFVGGILLPMELYGLRWAYLTAKTPLIIDLHRQVCQGRDRQGSFIVSFSDIKSLLLVCRLRNGSKVCQLQLGLSSGERRCLLETSFSLSSPKDRRKAKAGFDELLSLARQIARLLGSLPLVEDVEEIYINNEKV